MQEFSGNFFAFFYHYKPVVFNRFQSHLTHTLSCVSIQGAKNKNSEILFYLRASAMPFIGLFQQVMPFKEPAFQRFILCYAAFYTRSALLSVFPYNNPPPFPSKHHCFYTVSLLTS